MYTGSWIRRFSERACIVAAVIPGTIAVTVAQIIPLLPSSGDIRPILDRSKAKTAYKKDYHGETDYPCLLSFHRLFSLFFNLLWDITMTISPNNGKVN